MKLSINRKKGDIWTAQFIPENKREKSQLQQVAAAGVNSVSSTYGGRDRRNPLGFTLNFVNFIQPRPSGRFLLVGDK